MSYTLAFYFIMLQTVDTFQDSVMLVNLRKTEIIAGNVDGTVLASDMYLLVY